jgi:hypothetical protein
VTKGSTLADIDLDGKTTVCVVFLEYELERNLLLYFLVQQKRFCNTHKALQVIVEIVPT